MTALFSRLDRITVNPAVSHGAPTIHGMRWRVRDAVELMASRPPGVVGAVVAVTAPASGSFRNSWILERAIASH
ncbi:MAG: DUF433 domain-containing protein [Bifidobacteriaceae bacterium]|jgi:hypothetical protein|nr:DUF433 domain-containing protein [Bifidobacteriaceae bacterium]